MTKRVIFPTGPEAYEREGLKPIPEPWEDGLRADPGPGTLEWWYFDAHFDDGSTAVIVFLTKPMLERSSGLKPGVQMTITQPDGKKFSQAGIVKPAEFSASKDRCYVRSGESWVRGDLSTYEMHVKVGDLAAQLTLKGIVPPWRPGVGKSYYDEALTQYFGWFPAIPYGTVEGYLTYEGKIHAVKGNCYHDHNWANVGLNEVMSHWYWGRARVGDYTLIFVEMHASPAYGGQAIPVFMLAKGDKILTGDGEPLHLETQGLAKHPGGRLYPQRLDFHWKRPTGKGIDSIHIALRNPVTIEATSLLAFMPRWKQFIGRLFANPYYFRFNADLELSIDLGGLHARQKGKALYEVMLLR